MPEETISPENQETKSQEEIKNDLNELANLRLQNSLTELVYGIAGSDTAGTQISQVTTLFQNNRWQMLSNMRQILSQLYVEHGLVQALIDQPVDDAFRSGFKIKSKQLSEENVKELEVYLDKNNIIQTIAQSAKWARLYGGGGIIVMTTQKQDTPLKKISEFDKLKFKAVDMWELYYTKQNSQEAMIGNPLEDEEQVYNYYGINIHNSRVLIMKGKEAPSFIRQRLRGWGMSELERVVRSVNQFLKNQNVVFELLDEAKVDVYKLQNLNASLIASDGTDTVTKRVQLANQLKNFLNALVLDKEDEYDQKSVAFSGLEGIMTQIRQTIASDLKMPMTKLFGMSSAGFNSGEDDIENYNSMVDGEVRAKVKHIINAVLLLCCEKLFGFSPEDLSIEWGALRILSSEQEQKVKNDEFTRIMSAYSGGLIDAETAKKAINSKNLLPIAIEETDEIFANPTGNFGQQETEGNKPL